MTIQETNTTSVISPLPDTSKYSHISEEEMQVDVLKTSLPLERIATVEGISSIPPVLFFI